MEKFVINGGRKFDGKVKIESAKNSVLPILAGAILTNDEVVIKDCPRIKDVLVMIDILEKLGVKTRFDGGNLIVNSAGLNSCVIPYELGGELRSSVFLLGPLLARLGVAHLSLPGGCKIGARPIDIHVAALKSLGADFFDVSTEIFCRAERVIGAEIHLAYPSVGATENIVLASVLAEGVTKVINAAREPEVKDLCLFLRSMGAKIYGEGTGTIIIYGCKKLHGTVFKTIGDRIESGTFLMATLMNGGKVEITNGFSQNLSSIAEKLCNCTCKIDISNDIIYIKSSKRVKGFSLTTGPYPAFPTDLQAPACALACVADGSSVITETVFENRFLHIPELVRMGADIYTDNRRAVFLGKRVLHGATVVAKDLRGGAALVLAGLKAEGQTVVCDAKHITRGYYNLAEKFNFIGADIKFVSD